MDYKFSLVIDCLASNGQKTTSRLQRLLWSATAGVIIFLLAIDDYYVLGGWLNYECQIVRCSPQVMASQSQIICTGDGKCSPPCKWNNRAGRSSVGLHCHGWLSLIHHLDHFSISVYGLHIVKEFSFFGRFAERCLVQCPDQRRLCCSSARSGVNPKW